MNLLSHGLVTLARFLFSVATLLVLAACTATPLIVGELRLTSLQGKDRVPGIVSLFSDTGTARLVVFGIHGMGKTSPCASRTAAAMLSGDRGPVGSVPDTWKEENCFEPGVRHMPVCLGGEFQVESEAFPRSRVRRIIGDECDISGVPVSVRALFEHDTPEDTLPRTFRRFGVLTHRRIKPFLTAASGDRIQVEIDYYAYWWHGDANELQAPFVTADLSGPYAEERVVMNRLIKRVVMNEGLVDASLYLGESGGMMRLATRNAMCLMVRDLRQRIDTTQPVRDPCAGLGTRFDDVFGDRKVVILTQSLGSRILFDALSGFNSETNVRIAKAILGQQPLVYMSANQLPLLAISQVKVTPTVAPPGGRIMLRESAAAIPARQQFDFFQALTGGDAVPRAQIGRDESRALSVAPEIRETGTGQIVAFYDPNDILGYRAGDHLPEDRKKGIYEVTQRYAPPYFLLALPQQAHDRSFETEKGRRFVMCGAKRVSTEDRLRIAPECRG